MLGSQSWELRARRWGCRSASPVRHAALVVHGARRAAERADEKKQRRSVARAACHDDATRQDELRGSAGAQRLADARALLSAPAARASRHQLRRLVSSVLRAEPRRSFRAPSCLHEPSSRRDQPETALRGAATRARLCLALPAGSCSSWSSCRTRLPPLVLYAEVSGRVIAAASQPAAAGRRRYALDDCVPAAP